MALYTVEFGHNIGLRDGASARQVLRAITAEEGTNAGPFNVRRATRADVDWVRGMGGEVPEYDPKRLALKAAGSEE